VAHRNPWKARLAQHQQRWPRPLQELQAQAYAVLQIAYEGVAVDDAEARRKGIHVYFTALSCFAKLLEASELVALQERLAALEARLQESSNGHHASYAR
jgi:hypothetical protein